MADHLIPAALRDDVRKLGNLLGAAIRNDKGDGALELIETVRALAKSARPEGAEPDWTELANVLGRQNDATLVTIARAFNQFLNLANIAEQVHAAGSPGAPLRLPEHVQLEAARAGLNIELVLTAHPTEVLRRTMIQKYDAIAEALAADDDAALERLIAESWHSDEIRRTRPTPQDEAKWGFAVIENSLWDALPRTLREFDAAAAERGLAPLPLDAAPLRIATWMGGDRDGNPNVTGAVTEEVLLLGRWMAADLFLRDLDGLQASLSMTECNQTVRELAGDALEPYRAVIKGLRERLAATLEWAERRARAPDGGRDARRKAQLYAAPAERSSSILWDRDELLVPLLKLHESLCDCGMRVIAEGPLQDTIRRAASFGPTLTRLDIRQSSDRHADVFDELTRYLHPDEPGYNDWDEARRCEFLLAELNSRRPLFPDDWPLSEPSREVLGNCELLGRIQAAGIAQYIISMAGQPSDVLAVILLLRESGLARPLPIVPLFETLDDLERAPATLDALLGNDWYRGYAGGAQQVMIGYSDSAKDAGQFSAAWAQYRAQEELVTVAERHGVQLTLFHGRGGAVGRGGGPAQAAVRSQPPGSINGRLRVTEQGEMIRWKLGTVALARASLAGYISATLESSLNPPRAPDADERAAMTRMAAASLSGYRGSVRDDPDFVSLFRALTPERELGILALGSRPARRAATDDVASLRAIPWVFAWTQIRLMLPAWLGTERALTGDELAQVRAMLDWPFLRMQIDMLEMVLAKCEPSLTRLYARQLVPDATAGAVDAFCARLQELSAAVLTLREADELLRHDPELAASLEVRNTYLDPLHVLQAELLKRYRRDEAEDSKVARALRVTMAGIASGLRNTG
ncbi:MAG: phosphoenolpyruvate carboxylase [Pseudomonadota bacterium]